MTNTPQAYGVDLTCQEQEILKLPPKFSLYNRLDSKEFENQLERMNTELRYSARCEVEETDDSDSSNILNATEPVKNKSGDKLDASEPGKKNLGTNWMPQSQV